MTRARNDQGIAAIVAATLKAAPFVVVLGAALSASAQDLVDPDAGLPISPLAGGDEILFLDVVINGAPTGLIAEFRRDAAGRLSSPVTELVELGFDAPPGGEVVALDAIPSLDYRYDPMRQRVEIDVSPSALAPQRLGPPRAEILRADPSYGAAINYDGTLRIRRDAEGATHADGLGLALDAWIFTPWGRGGTTGYAVVPLDQPQDTQWLRYDTTIERDAIDRALSFRLGDMTTSSLSWGRAVRLGGLQVQKDFALRRDLVTAPLLTYSGRAAVPSTVDVFVEGAAVYSGVVEPGRFQLDNVPVPTGAGTATIALRGPGGETRLQDMPFFGARNLLRRGVLDYSVEAGRPRLGYGSIDSGYLDQTAASATVRVGATRDLTLSGHVEGMDETYLAGVGMEYALGQIAEMSITAGASRDSRQTGQFGEVTMSAYPLDWLSVSASLYRGSDDLADLAYGIDRATGTSGTAIRPPTARDVLSVGVTGGDQRFGLNYVRSDQAQRRNRVAGVGYSHAFDRIGGTLSLSASHDFESGEAHGAVLFNLLRGRRTHQIQVDDRQRASILTSLMPDERPEAMGYSLQATRDDDEARIGARLERKTRYGRAAGQIDVASGGASAEARFQGAVAYIDRRLAAGPKINDAFAIVDAGRGDIPVRLQNREVARTGSNGHALVSGLNSYYSNRLSVDVGDLPGDAVWLSTASEAVPARRSGVTVDFGISDISQSRLVTLVDRTGAPVALGTPVTVDGRANGFDVGYDGQVLLQDAGAGAVIVAEQGATRCEAILPAVSNPVSGHLPCL
ncbi:fimbria/pilus outer membrane usher protein [uncultured Limimaricola sp.]|uniref:fimbria/pilus outer membrane usher protein n=1 Tax=uncultured Limimaricola sp. TaxID=2211667 RepID=UPI0030F7A6A4